LKYFSVEISLFIYYLTYSISGVSKMDFKKNNKLIQDAIKAGCKTMAELALYLKLTARIRAA